MVTTHIPRTRTHSYKRFFGNLHTPDLLAKRPLIGVIMVVLGFLIFSIFAYHVQAKDALTHWDLQLANSTHEWVLNSPAWFKSLLIVGFYIGLQGYIVVGIVLGLYFLFKRFWKEFLIVAIGFAGEGGIWLLIANYFNRPRPEFQTRIGSVLNYPSFPSGHTISGVLCCALLAYLFVRKISSRLWKTVFIISAVLMSAFIGFSRFFMGAHYLTDVLAGFAFGIAWTALVFTSIELLFKKRSVKHV
jgi:membrane-associated phospholipid phosphatase